MELKIVRKIFTETSTIGELYVNGDYFCNTLEDKDRQLNQIFDLERNKDLKIYAQTAIPYGTYKVIISYSPRFKRLLPLLLNVPAFSGIRIHPGNAPQDTEGCILLGEYKGQENFIANSRKTFDKFFSILEEANKEEAITIQILQDEITRTRIRPKELTSPWLPFS